MLTDEELGALLHDAYDETARGLPSPAGLARSRQDWVRRHRARAGAADKLPGRFKRGEGRRWRNTDCSHANRSRR